MPKICAFKIFAPEPIERQPTGQRPELCNMEWAQGGAGGKDDFASWVRHLAAIWFSCLARRWHPFFRPPLLATDLAPGCHSEFSVCCLLLVAVYLTVCVCECVCWCVCCCHVRLSLFIFDSLRCRLLFCSLLLSFDFIACQLLIDIFQQVHKEPTMKWINSAKGPRYNPTPISHREWSCSTLCNRKKNKQLQPFRSVPR